MLLLWSSGQTPPCCCFPSPSFLSWLLLAASKISKAWNLIYHSCFLMKIVRQLNTFWNAASQPHYHSAYLRLHPDQYNQLIQCFPIWLAFCGRPSNTTRCPNKVLIFSFFVSFEKQRSWLEYSKGFFLVPCLFYIYTIYSGPWTKLMPATSSCREPLRLVTCM